MIDREKVIDGLCGAIGLIHGYIPKSLWADGYEEQACRDAIALLKEQPEIIRCKDCKYHSDEKILEYKVCTKWNKHLSYFSTADDWFCADGERK